MSDAPRPVVALTPGEPAGIGPDLLIMLMQKASSRPCVVVGDPELLVQRAARLGLPLVVETVTEDRLPRTPSPAGHCRVLPVPLAAPCTPGRLDPRNARAVLASLDTAARGCLAGRFAAMVTAPVNKAVINDAGVPFTGHTELLAEIAGIRRPVMLLVGGDLRVALATTHLPLSEVAGALGEELLVDIGRILSADLQRLFGIARPRIAVLGLNPHAGESGHLGDEEQRIIGPAIERLRAGGVRVDGPLPADTAFTPRVLSEVDAVLAMYHDQGLPVLKYASFGSAVNVTLGLPFVRTSVDHGTALDLAGSGDADPSSLGAALELAETLAATRERDGT